MVWLRRSQVLVGSLHAQPSYIDACEVLNGA
jgi:hypothetical protein